VSAGPNEQPALEVTGLEKRFGEIAAVDGVDLELAPGSICALLGPSGCGKTTFLRLISGLERPDAGRIAVGGEVLSDGTTEVPPERRRIGMVFQDYALFPHLDVGGNVAYGLGRGAPAGRIGELLELVGLNDTERRPVHELSGGQQQRVALARALAPDPELILLDEPFSNLDASLRGRVREDVRRIISEAGVTALFVTHDQEEALSIAESVAMMRDGRVEQFGTPEELYSRPATRWVAGFLGEIEVLPGTARNGIAACELGELPAPGALSGAVDVMVRPESLAIDTSAPRSGHAQDALVVSRRFYGHDQMLELELPSGRRVHSRRLGFPAWHPGDRVRVWIEGPADIIPAVNGDSG
jgi:iron(III) transport system ATP-binding protein